MRTSAPRPPPGKDPAEAGPLGGRRRHSKGRGSSPAPTIAILGTGVLLSARWSGAPARLPFADYCFDATLSFTVMEEVDAPRTLAEMVRVTRPGGRVGVVVRASDIRVWLNARLDSALMEKVETAPGAGAAAAGCAHAGLYDLLAAAGLARVWGGPRLAIDPGDGGWMVSWLGSWRGWRPRMQGRAGTRSPGQRRPTPCCGALRTIARSGPRRASAEDRPTAAAPDPNRQARAGPHRSRSKERVAEMIHCSAGIGTHRRPWAERSRPVRVAGPRAGRWSTHVSCTRNRAVQPRPPTATRGSDTGPRDRETAAHSQPRPPTSQVPHPSFGIQTYEPLLDRLVEQGLFFE